MLKLSLAGNRLSAALLGCLLLGAACTKASSLNERAYVVPERAKLRNSTAQAARVLGELKSGDQVTVLKRANAEDGNNWSNVKAGTGETGWLESKWLVKENIVAQSRQIAEQIKDTPTQARGKSKAQLKLRLTPDRTSEENVATTLPAGTALEIVARTRKPRPASIGAAAPTPTPSGKGASNATEKKDEIKYDEWLQVRLRDYAVLPAGWIYGGSVELDAPQEIVYFASAGRKIVGWQKIGTLSNDDGKSGEHYLVAERKIFDADERVDFDRVKVLAYEPKSRNYSTPFRDDVAGRFPIVMKMEGTRGSFQLNLLDKAEQPQTADYQVEMLDGGRVKVTKPAKPGAKPNKK